MVPQTFTYNYRVRDQLRSKNSPNKTVIRSVLRRAGVDQISVSISIWGTAAIVWEEISEDLYLWGIGIYQLINSM
jgi:hypothetical protein